MRVAGDWTDRDGSDLKSGIVTEKCWVSRVEIVPTSLRVVGTSVGQRGSVCTGPVGPFLVPMVTELVVAMRMSTVPSQLIDRASTAMAWNWNRGHK